jgi:general transcriptional corepressor TUP1
LLQIWDISKRRIRHLLQGHGQEIYSLDFSADGRHLVSGSGDKSARIWDIETGSCIFDLKVDDFVMGENGPADAGLTSVAVSPDGRTVAAGSLDAVVRVWDAQTGKQLARLAGHSDSVYSVAFAPDGQVREAWSFSRSLLLLR